MTKRTHVVCLFDENGLSGHDWALAGFDVFCYDILHVEVTTKKVGKGTITFVPWDARSNDDCMKLYRRHKDKIAFLMSFPPCTDLAVSGAAWFKSKELKNPRYRQEAMQLVYISSGFGIMFECPFFIENPVSVISTEWRKPDYIFQPYEYGGYLPKEDVHPKYPDYIAPRDAYPKKTCYWVGNGFIMPPKKAVKVSEGYSTQHLKLGGKSAKTKSIRSATPRGIMRAIYEYNKALS